MADLGPGTMPRGKYPESPAPAGSHALISRTPPPGGMLHANLGLPRPPPRNFQPPLPRFPSRLSPRRMSGTTVGRILSHLLPRRHVARKTNPLVPSSPEAARSPEPTPSCRPLLRRHVARNLTPSCRPLLRRHVARNLTPSCPAAPGACETIPPRRHSGISAARRRIPPELPAALSRSDCPGGALAGRTLQGNSFTPPPCACERIPLRHRSNLQEKNNIVIPEFSAWLTLVLEQCRAENIRNLPRQRAPTPLFPERRPREACSMPISGCHDLPLATFNLPSRVSRHSCRRAGCPE